MTTGAERETAFDPSKPFMTRGDGLDVGGAFHDCKCWECVERRRAVTAAPVAQSGTEDAESDAKPLVFTYRNYRGKTAERRVMPKGVRWGSTEWHPEPQWLLLGFDLDKQADREFAMQDIALARRGITHDAGAVDEGERVARFFHDRYEHHGREQSWATHVDCRTSFEELPERNRKVMLLTVADVLAALSARVRDDGAGMMRAAEIAEKHYIERPQGADWGLMDDRQRTAFNDAQREHQHAGRLIAEAIRTAAPEQGADRGWRSQATTDVLAERRRQVEAEGWTPEHDDTHDDGQLALAAVCYALPAWQRTELKIPSGLGERTLVERLWPWERGWWRPRNARRDLVKAGALILAEIERLDRLPSPPTPVSK